MNRLVKMMMNGEESYVLTTEDGSKFVCKRWFETKTGAWHVKLPDGNPSGRTYVRESYFDKGSEVEFETKTEFRTGLSSGGWKAKLTPEEAKEVAHHELCLENIKKAAQTREVVKLDPNSLEGIEAEIAKLLAKKARIEAK